MKKAISLFSFSLLFQNIFSQISGDWERLGEVPATEIQSIDIKTNGAIYAGIYRSFDGGDSWEKHDEELTRISRNGTIFYSEQKTEQGTNRGFTEVRYSQDNGSSWRTKQLQEKDIFKFTSLSSGKWLAVKQKSQGNYDVIFSSDEGDSWEYILSTNSHAPFIEIDDNVIFHAQSIRAMSIGNLINLNNDQIQTGEIRVEVYNYDDSYLNFTKDAEGNLWALADSGLAKSKDGGFSWKKIDFGTNKVTRKTAGTPLGNGVFIAQITFTASTVLDSVVYLKSDNGESDWEAFTPENPIRFWHQYLPDGTIFGFAGGLVRSDDLGETWGPADLDLPEGYDFAIYEWFGKDSIYALALGRLAQSFDGGRNWELIQEDRLKKWLNISHISKNVNRKQLFGAGKSIFLSEDSGQTFIDISPPWNLKSPIPNYYQYNLNISPTGDFVAGSDGGLYISYDNGDSWTQTVDSLYFFKTEFSKNDVWVGQAAKIGSSIPDTYRSVDRGKTWEILPSFGYGYNFQFDKEDRLVFEKNSRMRVSDDYGDNFEYYGIPFDVWEFEMDTANNLISEMSVYPEHDRHNRLHIPRIPVELLLDPQWVGGNNRVFFQLSPDNFFHRRVYKNGFYRFNVSTTDFAKKSPTQNFIPGNYLVKTFPNPTQNTFTLSLPQKQNTDTNLLIFNNLSQKVFEQKLPKSQSEHQIDGLNLNQGIYYFLIKNQDEIIGNGKLIISEN